MKPHIILTISMLSLATTCTAQNTFPGSGNVGIGTSAPVGSLDIFTAQNTTTVPLISLRSNFHVVGNYGMIRFGDYTQTTQYQKGAIIYESVSGAARGKFHIAMENTDGAESVTLADARLTIQSDGNVGIGTTNPSEKLAVNGKIRAKEVKVEATGWPDFVFQKDYKISSLADLDRFIKLNKHLPGIPSAQQVKENGIELGEMNKLLLQKIEELSLHLIEKDKTIEGILKRMDEIEKKVKK